VQVLNLFLALLLSSFGAESLKHSEEDEGPNKLQEAVDRINRFSVFVKSHAIYCFNVYVRRRGAAFLADADDPDAAYGYLAGPTKPRVVAAPPPPRTTRDAAGGGSGAVLFSNGHLRDAEMSPDAGGVDGLAATISPQHHQANGELASSSVRCMITLKSACDRRAEYCNEHVCLSVCLCLFVCPRSYLRNYTSDLHHFFARVTYGRGSVLFWRRSDSYVLPVLWMTSYSLISQGCSTSPPS